jgi:uncharacterized protein YpuA (DUF1002 family)
LPQAETINIELFWSSQAISSSGTLRFERQLGCSAETQTNIMEVRPGQISSALPYS